MYTVNRAKNGDLKHSHECQMAFGRKDAQCPRCVTMMHGAPARKGWQHDYYTVKARQEERLRQEIREHDCNKSHCGPVCTAFDW